MKISKNDLCSKCRNIRPKLNSANGPTLGDPLEVLLESKGYDMPNGYMFINPAILTYLEEDGGCSSCISLLKRATT